jgi:hypothetical protein
MVSILQLVELKMLFLNVEKEIDLRNEFIFLFGDGVSPEKNDGKLHHCA